MGLMPETESCDAILQAWYPGEAGGQAVTDVLFGEYNPAGRLPVTFYKNVDQLPDFEDYDMKGRTYRYMDEAPLFAFGHGLSYSKFKYGKAKADNKKLSEGEVLNLTIPVQNAGSYDGDEVVQVYLKRPNDKEGPHKALRAFQRVSIAKGQKQPVHIQLPYESVDWFVTETTTMSHIPVNYAIHYGGISDDKTLKSIKLYL